MSKSSIVAFIDVIKNFPGAATILANKLLGRFIGQVARGFTGPEVQAMAALYLAILKANPTGTIEFAAMLDLMLKRAEQEESGRFANMGFSDEEQAELAASAGNSAHKQLIDAAKPAYELLKAQEPSYNAWDDLPQLAQWSLALATEQGIKAAIQRYSTWESDRGAELLQETQDAQAAVSAAVLAMQKQYSDVLEEARSNGINVRQRPPEQATEGFRAAS